MVVSDCGLRSIQCPDNEMTWRKSVRLGKGSIMWSLEVFSSSDMFGVWGFFSPFYHGSHCKVGCRVADLSRSFKACLGMWQFRGPAQYGAMCSATVEHKSEKVHTYCKLHY